MGYRSLIYSGYPNDYTFTNVKAVADTTKPTVVSATVDITGLIVVIRLSENVTGHTGFSTTQSTLTYVSGDGTTILTFNSNSAISSAHVGLNYAPGNVVDRASNALDAITDGPMTNNSADAVPTLTSATISTDGSQLVLGFSEIVNNHTGFTLTPTNVLTYVSGDVTNVKTFDLASLIKTGDSVTLDYAPGDVVDATAHPVEAITAFAVTNNSTVPHAPAPSAYYKLNTDTTDSSGNSLDATPTGAGYSAAKYATGLSAGDFQIANTVFSGQLSSTVMSVSFWTQVPNGGDNVAISCATMFNINIVDEVITVTIGSTTLLGSYVRSNAFMHIALTISAGVASLYVDGVLNATQNVISESSTFGPFANKGEIITNGILDDVVFLGSTALTADQIALIAASSGDYSTLI